MMSDEHARVVLEGDGIAAVCVARLLADADIACIHQPAPIPRSKPHVLLSSQTQSLLRTLFPACAEHPRDIFEDFTPIRRRVVLWNHAPEPLDLPHYGISVSEAELLDLLWKRVPARLSPDGRPAQCIPAWRVKTSRSGTVEDELQVGRCEATVCTVVLIEGAQTDACWVEAVHDGWLFLLALGKGRASLISVGGEPAMLLDSSRLIARQVLRMNAPEGSFSSHPRLSRELATQDVLRCGSAAMSFDPLCGEGAGNAVREALLAAAVIRASFQGSSVEKLTHHYTDRLRLGFLRHLENSLRFYITGGEGPFWTQQASALQRGIETVRNLRGSEPSARFRLIDRDLVAVTGV